MKLLARALPRWMTPCLSTPCWMILATLLFLGLPAAGQTARAADANRLTPEELADGWVLLFDGETKFGWVATSDADWKVADGVISVGQGKQGLLRTTSPFSDYLLQVDFRNPNGTNSGVFLRSAAEPKDPATDCYELNIAAESISPFPTGSFVARKKGANRGETPDWRTYVIRAEGPRFSAQLDGKQVIEYTDPKPLLRGFIGLQFNTGKIEFRNIKLKPLGLRPIFNGKDLAGWHGYPGKQSVFAVTPEGWLSLKNGPGQLESDARFADFVLQLEVFTNGKNLNSGVFFRNIPGEFALGYESQIHNGFVDNDRTRPLDYGTGAIYRRQKARKVVADDFTWFQKTLVVSGKHMAVWVNGYQVTDWTDPRPPDENPRKGLRLAAGTLALQGHDKTTDLSFRRIQAAEMPPSP